MESSYMTICLPKNLHERLKVLAKEDNRSLSQFVKIALEERFPENTLKKEEEVGDG